MASGLSRAGVCVASAADALCGLCDWPTGRGVPWRCSGCCGLLVSSVNECGDGVAAQGESDHHAVLAGGGVRGHASAVEVASHCGGTGK